MRETSGADFEHGGTLIRPYERQDWAGVWAILEPVFRASETYAVPRDISSKQARQMWTGSGTEVFVATALDTEAILGTYYLKANHPGPGSHVCNCGYAVHPDARGRGVATAMCRHSQERALSRGFRAMQFNLVAASNEGAVRLWEKLGFEIVGTLPGAFEHPELGFVDAHVMYQWLAEEPQVRSRS